MRFDEIKLGWYLDGAQRIEVTSINSTRDEIKFVCDAGVFSNLDDDHIKHIHEWICDAPGYKVTEQQLTELFHAGMRHTGNTMQDPSIIIYEFIEYNKLRLIK